MLAQNVKLDTKTVTWNTLIRTSRYTPIQKKRKEGTKNVQQYYRCEWCKEIRYNKWRNEENLFLRKLLWARSAQKFWRNVLLKIFYRSLALALDSVFWCPLPGTHEELAFQVSTRESTFLIITELNIPRCNMRQTCSESLRTERQVLFYIWGFAMEWLFSIWGHFLCSHNIEEKQQNLLKGWR